MTERYDRSIRIRPVKGGDQPLSIIFDYLNELPFDHDHEAEVLKLLTHKYLFFALKAQGHPDELLLKQVAHEAIGVFQSIADSIREAADIAEENKSNPYFLFNEAMKNGKGNGNGSNSSGIDKSSVKERFSEADDIFGLN